MAIRLLVTLLSIVNILLGVSANPGHPRSVNVELRAKWSGTPILLEMGELLAKERQDYLWILVNNWIDIEPELVSASQDHCLQSILDQGSSLISGPLASILHLSLLLRLASAKLVLYRQLAQESLAHYSASGIRTPEIALDSTDAERWAISENPRISTGRCCWIDDGSRILFDESDIVEWIKHANSSKKEPELFEFDHVYPGGDSSKGTLVLYGALGTTCFKRLHSILTTASKEGIVKYVYRPVLPSGCESTAGICAQLGGGALNLAGYGVELALKNMEYKAIDDTEVRKETKMENARTDDLGEDVRGFIFSKLLERKPHLAGELMTFRDQLLSSDVSDTMSIWELKDLGYQTAQRIIQAAEPLRLMQEINQNFPNLVSSLSRMKLNDTVKEEIVANQRLLPAGRSLFAINGGLINVETLDIFTILELVRQELSVSDQLLKMKVPPKFINQLLQLPEPVDEGLVRIDFRSNYVHYLNNIEQDDMYRRWRSNLNELLMPVFPGQLRYIRKNLYHAVYIFDPASSKGLQITESIMHYYQSSMPMRFGVILLSSRMIRKLEGTDTSMELEDDIESSPFEADVEDLSCLAIQLFLYVKEKLGVQEAFEFLSHAYDVYDGENEGEDGSVDESAFQEAFIDSFKTMTKSAVMEVYSMVKESHIYKEDAIKSTSFVYELGLSQMHPCLLMNGIFYGPNQVQSAATVAMNEELQRIQEGVYFGRIDSRTDILDKFLSDEGYKRYNPQIVTTDKEARKYVPIAHLLVENHPVIRNLGYLHSPGTQDDVKPVTHWLILDLTQKIGIRFLKQALSYMMSGSSKARLGILTNILNVDGLSETKQFPVRIIHSVLQLPSRRAKVLPFLHEFFAQNTFDTLNLEERTKAVLELADKIGLNSKDLKKMLEEPFQHEHMVENLHEERKLVTQAFALEPGSNAVITNGRVFVQTSGNLFQAEDFALVESVEYIKRIKPLQDVIETVEWGGLEPDEVSSDFLSNVIMVGSSSMASRARGSDSARFDLLKSEFSGIIQQRENSSIHVDAVIDPLSTTGQKITPLLVLLQEWIQPSMRIVMNPMSSLTDIPLKNFYRYILPSKFDFHTAIKPGPAGRFSSLPSSRTLTMNMDVPEPWLVEPVVAIHDLDNIVLEKLGDEKTLYAVFELEALMITGHCFEESNDPPRGLQLILGSKQKPHMVDTIVMANLGYFQLKAAPGVWTLKLAEGRSSELYTFNGIAEGTNSGSTSKRVIVDDMKGKLVRLTVVKRKGKEDEKLLLSSDESELPSDNGKEGKGFLKWAKTIIGGGKKQSMDSNDSLSEGKHHVRRGVTINIFSVASGHLYERFLKIMMLSVLKNTRRPVKFWFIKNYLSPQFKDLIPYMAKEYGFEYQLVTYKWPSWLHKQTEKQRIIWAYKILFLDVIFPLSLKKVIFVDADQIIRTDMGELYDMNLKGRPLAYTPFCDNNKEMDGFRFWNQGFWRDHLQGRPYHISALYVVDLVKFRQTAAGDNLRVFYENLSKDPNSLSNLDQDLPNYAQHTVPIFSLPQEWLWCESWCGNATKAKAKTIDLCNNPMTKEPKLQGARRIVEEWPALDEEARQFTVKVQESQIGSEIENETSVQVGDDFPTVVESHDEL